MTLHELADAVGISERTLRSIERDERPDARTIGLVEVYLGLDKELPQNSPSPSLEQSSDAELAVEIFRRLQRARVDSNLDAPLPDEVRAEPDLLIAPADEGAEDRPSGS